MANRRQSSSMHEIKDSSSSELLREPHRPKTPSFLSGQRTLLKLVAEATVVFLGVFGAFMLEEHRSQARDQIRLAKIRSSLEVDLRSLNESLQLAVGYHQSGFVDGFLSPYKAGETIKPLPIPFATTPINTGSWEAMLASGGFDVLDAELMREIELLFSQTSHLHSTMERYNSHVMTLLIPDIDQPTADFYGTDGQLKGKYRWYVYFHQSIQKQLKTLAAQSEDLDKRISSTALE